MQVYYSEYYYDKTPKFAERFAMNRHCAIVKIE
jgi:hypothetical protein